jgi:hypothetical protein
MALPTFASGTKVRASTLTALVTELQNLYSDTLKVAKTGDTTRATSSMSIDPHLSLSLLASTTYDFDLALYHNAPSANDIQFAMSFPSGASVTWGGVRLASGASSVTGEGDFGVYIAPTSSTSAIAAGGTGGDQLSIIRGTIVLGVTPGALALFWADNSGSGSVTLRNRSTMRAHRYRAAP